MKVLLINSVSGVKSTGRICTDLADALLAEGHDVRIGYGRDGVPEKYRAISVRIGNPLGVRLHALFARLLDASGFGSRGATRRFLRFVRRYDPDVIHLHNLHGYYLHLPTLFRHLRKAGKPIVWTLHDAWPITGHGVACDAVPCEKYKTECSHCPQKREYPKSFFDFSRRNFRKKKKLFSDMPNLHMVTPSHWLADVVAQSFLADAPTSVIPNGIDTARFSPCAGDARARLGCEGKVLLLGVASAWSDMKGYGDFLRLAERLGDGYRIVLVGVTPRQRASLPPNMIGITRTNSIEELAELYSAADLFVNLTYNDNYPTVNLEARACGLPCLTYRTGGSPESAGEEAIVVPRGDLDGVVRAILAFEPRPHTAPDPEMLAAFDKARATREYLDLYRLIEKNGAGGSF